MEKLNEILEDLERLFQRAKKKPALTAAALAVVAASVVILGLLNGAGSKMGERLVSGPEPSTSPDQSNAPSPPVPPTIAASPEEKAPASRGPTSPPNGLTRPGRTEPGPSASSPLPGGPGNATSQPGEAQVVEPPGERKSDVLALSVDELIKQKEGRSPGVIARLDRDIATIERQAFQAKDQKLRRDVYERVMRDSFEMTKQLQDIKATFIRLNKVYIEDLRNGQVVAADDVLDQIRFQLHDRYLAVVSHNVGWNSPGTEGLHFRDEFEHVVINGQELARQPDLDRLYGTEHAKRTP